MILSINDSKVDSLTRLMIDANIAISYFDLNHKFHAGVKKRIQSLFLNGSTFYYSQPVYLELKNYWRRKLITECIEQHLKQDKKLYSKFEKQYRDFKSNNLNDLLKEHQLKQLRETLENVSKGKGVEYWFLLCDQALRGQFDELDQTLAQSNFKYAKFGDDDVYPLNLKNQWPQWSGVDALMEKYGLASSDAAILNMVNGGQKIEGFISNDGDILFAAAKGALSAIPVITFLDTTIFHAH